MEIKVDRGIIDVPIRSKNVQISFMSYIIYEFKTKFKISY